CRGDHLRVEAAPGVRAVAERLVVALPAAAQPDDRPAGDVVLVALRVVDLEVALDAERSVVVHRNLRRHSLTFRFGLEPDARSRGLRQRHSLHASPASSPAHAGSGYTDDTTVGRIRTDY